MSDCGHYDHLVERRDAVLSGARVSASARARIMGRPHLPPFTPSTDPKPRKIPEPKIEHIPVPIALRPCCSGNWRRLTDEKVPERVRAILRATAKAFDVGPGEMRDPSRTRRLAYPRFAAMYLMRKVLRLSTSSIGRVLHRDHTTVLAGLDRAAELRRTDPDFRGRSIATVRALRAGRGQAEAQQ